MIKYEQTIYKKWRVVIINLKTGRVFDNYIIKVPDYENMAEYERKIHASYPNSILSVKFEAQ